MIAFILIVGLLYIYFTRNYGYWSKKGIPTVPNPLPGLGNTWKMYTLTQNFATTFHNMYKQGKGLSMIGFYDMTTPGILIRDPELVKSVLATNFHKFSRNQAAPNPQNDPTIEKNPFFKYGEEWKSLRVQLTRMLSAAKLRMVFLQVEKVCGLLDSYIEAKMGGSRTVELEMKRLFSRYASELVANSVFGINGYSFDDDYKGCSFLDLSERIFHPCIKTTIRAGLTLQVPSFGSLFKASFVPKDIAAELYRMIESAIDERLVKGVVKNDILQLIFETVQAENMNKDYVLNVATTFLIDMFETTGTTMTYIAFHLAADLKVQERVRNEIICALKNHDDKVTYELLKELTYMDQVVNETTRLYTIMGTMNKMCTENFELVGSDGLSCVVEPGNIVSISADGFHYDEEYWSDPNTFDPERFSEENINKIRKFAYLPFGEGPRACPGRMLAMMMMKSVFVHLLQKYSFTLSKRTKLPLEQDPYHFFVYPRGGVWINIEKIAY